MTAGAPRGPSIINGSMDHLDGDGPMGESEGVGEEGTEGTAKIREDGVCCAREGLAWVAPGKVDG